MSDWQRIVHQQLRHLLPERKTWLVTGAAGFIGSNIAEILLSLDQEVIAVDNLSSGSLKNIEDLRRSNPTQAQNLYFHETDINDLSALEPLAKKSDFILHQAALGSVTRSINTPLLTHDSNVTGFLTVLEAARKSKRRRIVFASSSSVYGSDELLPKIEDRIGLPLSPYAASKRCDEIYAASFANTYGMEMIGLRYFNVFGPRQSPHGPYAAVIPIWSDAIRNGRAVKIYGDGLTSRDFCFVGNIVYANILSAITPLAQGTFHILNIAAGKTTSLNDLASLLHSQISKKFGSSLPLSIERGDFRAGDIRHSLADINAAKSLLSYSPPI